MSMSTLIVDLLYYEIRGSDGESVVFVHVSCATSQAEAPPYPQIFITLELIAEYDGNIMSTIGF